jgi:ABC-type multidrug transport system fused ATPase/permease subunit
MKHLVDAWALLTRSERWRAFAVMVLTFFGAAAEALGIGLVFPFISLLGDPGPVVANPLFQTVYAASGAPSLEKFVLIGAVALIGVYVAKNLFLGFLYFVQARFVCGVEARLGTDLLAMYLRSPYVARLQRNSTEQLRMITAEVGRATAGFILPVIALLTEGLVVLAIAILLFAVQPKVTLAALCFVGVSGWVLQRAFKRKLGEEREARSRSNIDMFKWAGQGMGALKEMKVLGREDHFVSGFARSSAIYARATGIFNAISLLPRLVVETLAITLLLSLVALALATEQKMDQLLPMLTLFGLAAARIMPSTARMVGATSTIRYYASSVAAVAADLKEAEPQAARTPGTHGGTRPRRAFERLELADVFFRYPDAADDGLKAVTLAIRRGEMVAIVGRSGSGKTTLGDTILGLLAPQRGSVRINGAEVASLHDEWPGLCALVPQDFFLLDDTVRRNVAFGIPDEAIDDARVWQALRAARVEARIQRLPEGLDSLVGERGAMLSGGERQRLSIARALYDAPDILVLDEATSALDPSTESEILDTLESLAGSTTVVLITHRLAAAQKCGRIILMQAGTVVRDGPTAGADMGQVLDALVETDSSTRA